MVVAALGVAALGACSSTPEAPAAPVASSLSVEPTSGGPTTSTGSTSAAGRPRRPRRPLSADRRTLGGPTTRAGGPGGVATGLPAGRNSLVYVPAPGIRVGGATMALDEVEYEPGDCTLKLKLRLASRSDSDVNLARAGVHIGVKQSNTTTEADLSKVVASALGSRPTLAFKDLPAGFTLQGSTPHRPGPELRDRDAARQPPRQHHRAPGAVIPGRRSRPTYCPHRDDAVVSESPS